MKTQVRLVDGGSWTVGFVKSDVAVEGARLVIGDREWIVSEVYASESDDLVAWWYRARRVAA